MKLVFSAVLLFLFPVLYAGELSLDNEWRIVLPPPGGDPILDRHIRSSARLLRDSLKRAAGLALRVVEEKTAREGAKRIFIASGSPSEATGLNLDPKNLWEYAIAAKEGDLYLFGNDRRWRKDGSYDACTLGTVKAVTSFLEEFCGTDFLYPGKEGIAVRKMRKISFPDDLRIRRTPRIVYGIGRRQEMFYDIANNLFPGPWNGTYGGHSHDVAIPVAEYAGKHPEYFAIVNGKRDLNPGYPAYCLSNPEVQELIYQELLRHADKGYQMVPLGQSDGFRGCECPGCRKLYGVSEWSEKLWIMHTRMAERFAKDRPGKLVQIIAYGPTRTPPRTFFPFPDNVVVELAPCTPAIMKLWRKHKVKNGFTAYLYNWGYYQTEGFTPKNSFAFLSAQTAGFQRFGIRGVYFCGFGELFGLEGPAYYQFLKQLENPELKSGDLLGRYCKGLFGEAAPEMLRFYSLLDERLQLDIPDRVQDWNDPDLLMNRKKDRDLTEPLRLLQVRWTPAVMKELENLLSIAEKKNSSAPMRHVRNDFEYLKLTAAVAARHEETLRSGDPASGRALLEAVAARNRFIAQPRGKSIPAYFGGVSNTVLRNGGRMYGILPLPFTMDAEWMLKENILPAGRVIRAGKENSGPQTLAPAVPSAGQHFYQDIRARIRCRRDDKYLYVTFLFDHVKQEDIRNDGIQVYLGLPDQPETWKKIFVGIKSSSAAYTKLTRVSADNKGMGNVYEPPSGKVKERAQMTAPAPGCGETSVQIAVPFAWFGRVPGKGERWPFNAAYQRNRRFVIWQFNPAQKNWRNMADSPGGLVFEE